MEAATLRKVLRETNNDPLFHKCWIYFVTTLGNMSCAMNSSSRWPWPASNASRSSTGRAFDCSFIIHRTVAGSSPAERKLFFSPYRSLYLFYMIVPFAFHTLLWHRTEWQSTLLGDVGIKSAKIPIARAIAYHGHIASTIVMARQACVNL